MRKKNRICCIFDQAAHYRAPIYRLMDRELECDFYISKWRVDPFKQMVYDELTGLKSVTENKRLLGPVYWQGATVRLALSSYKKYLMIGNLHSLSTWVLLFLLKLLGKDVYLWSHGWYGKEGAVKSLFKRLFFHLAKGTFVYGERAKNLMIENGISSESVFVIYNSLDYQKQIIYLASQKSTKIYNDFFGNDNPVLVYIGRIQKVKRIDLLLLSMKELADRGTHLNCVIIGEKIGDEFVDLMDLVKAYSLEDRVWFFGSCYDESKICELIYNADLCVSPGNVGLTAVHSMTYGTPVITHNNFSAQMPEFEVIIPGKTGLFFEEGSVTDLVIKIDEWVSTSAENRERIRINCYNEIASKYNPEVQIKILRDVLGGKKYA